MQVPEQEKGWVLEEVTAVTKEEPMGQEDIVFVPNAGQKLGISKE